MIYQEPSLIGSLNWLPSIHNIGIWRLSTKSLRLNILTNTRMIQNPTLWTSIPAVDIMDLST